MNRKWTTLIVVSLGTLMLLLDITIVNVALPDIQSSLRSSFSDLQWVIDAYALTLAALLLNAGSLADLFGRRIVFAIGLALFSASSLLCGVATTPLFLDLARGAQGIGGATIFATSLALLAHAFRGRERGLAFGVWGAVTGVAVAIGPVLGGLIISALSWRWIFLVNVPIGIITIAITLVGVEESRQPGARRPDYIGMLTFSGALGALVYALINSESKGWGSTLIVGCLAGAAVGLGIFLIVERAQASPMFDLSLFRKPTFSGGSIAAFVISSALFSLLLYLVLYLQDVLGYSALDAGVRLAVLSGGVLVAATVAGRLTAYVPIRLLIGPGLALVGAGLVLMRGLNASSDWTHLIPGFIVAGIGAGLTNPALASTAIGVVEPARAGMASGINNTCRQVGIATGIAGLGSIFQHQARSVVADGLGAIPGLSPAQAHSIAGGLTSGNGAGQAISTAPAPLRPALSHVLRTGFTTGLNDVLMIAAIVAFAGSALSFLLIRNKDFAAAAKTADSEPAAVAEQPPAESPPEPVGTSENGATLARTDETSSINSESRPAHRANLEAVVNAAEQAAIDSRNQIEQAIASYDAEAQRTAEAEARELREQAQQRSADYAAELRSYMDSLDQRLTELRSELGTVDDSSELTDTRRALYELIQEFGQVPEQVAPPTQQVLRRS